MGWVGLAASKGMEEEEEGGNFESGIDRRQADIRSGNWRLYEGSGISRNSEHGGRRRLSVIFN